MEKYTLKIYTTHPRKSSLLWEVGITNTHIVNRETEKGERRFTVPSLDREHILPYILETLNKKAHRTDEHGE